MNIRRRLELIESIGTVIGVAFGLAVAILAGLPPCVIIVVLVYTLGLVLYLFLPWDSWLWKTDDEKKKNFKKIFRWWHSGLLAALLVIPIVCVLGGLSIRLLPQSADNALIDGIENANKGTVMMRHIEVLQANLLQTNTAPVSGSVIGIVNSPSMELLPTEAVVREILKPILWTIVNAADFLSVIIFLLVCAVLTAEKIVTKLHQLT